MRNSSCTILTCPLYASKIGNRPTGFNPFDTMEKGPKLFSSIQTVSIILVHICICIRIFVGHVMSPHHSDQLSQWSQVSRIAL